MLYYSYQMGARLLKPVHDMAALYQKALQHHLQQYPSSFAKQLLNASTILERDTREYGQPSYDIEQVTINDAQVKVKEVHELEHPFCTLVHFAKDTPHKGTKLLVVAPLSGHYPSLLRDTVSRLLESHDVYLTGWKNSRDIPIQDGAFDLDGYIDLLLSYYQYLGSDFAVVAVCQPTVPVVVATVIAEQNDWACRPSAIVLMGGPIDTRVSPSDVNEFSKNHSIQWFDHNMITVVPPPYAGAGRRVCPGFIMLSGFMSLDPKRHFDSHLKFYENLVQGSGEKIVSHTKFYDEFRSVMDLPAEFILQTIDRVFHRHLLPQNEFHWHGTRIDLSHIKQTAILTIEGELDNISPVGQTSSIHKLTPSLPDSKKQDYLQMGAGHYGIFSGRKWRKEVAPTIENFVAKSMAPKRKSTKASPKRVVKK